jgi:hypothetical protein
MSSALIWQTGQSPLVPICLLTSILFSGNIPWSARQIYFLTLLVTLNFQIIFQIGFVADTLGRASCPTDAPYLNRH